MIKKHNIEVYKNFKKMLNEKGSVILVSATGIGKSYITEEYINEYNLSALVVTPRIAICKSWEDMGNSKISTVTYQKFSKHYNEFHGFDIYVFDEVHHIGSKVWGKAIKEFLSKEPGTKYIGLSATATRNDGVDIIEEFFKDREVCGYNLIEAIEEGIFPKTKYVRALYNTDGVREKVNNADIDTELRGRLMYNIDNCVTIDKILLKHIGDTKRKGIVFVDSIFNSTIAHTLITNLFPKEKVFAIHSKMDKKQVSENFDEFSKSDSGYIIAVDMLNEGIHLKNVDTVIMLRRTTSLNVYLQQIGRCMSTDIKNAIIFDFVANCTNIEEDFRDILDTSSYNIDEENSENIILRKFSNQIILYDYTSPIAQALKNIPIFKYWTDDEKNKLTSYIEQHGFNTGCQMFSEESGRSIQAVIAMAYQLGYSHFKHWRDDEKNKLTSYIEQHGFNTGCQMFSEESGRSIRGVTAMAYQLGYNCSILWTDNEKNKLISYIECNGSNKGCQMFSEESGRSIRGVMVMAHQLGYNCSNHWTDDEKNKLTSYIKHHDYIKGCQMFSEESGRSIQAVMSMARQMGYKCNNHWTEEEKNKLISYIKQHGHAKGCRMFSEESGKSESGAKTIARQMGYAAYKCWTDEDRSKLASYIDQHGFDTGCQMFSEESGKTYAAVKTMANRMGHNSNKHWTDKDRSKLASYIDQHGYNTGCQMFSEESGRTDAAVKTMANRIGYNSKNS